MWPTPPGRGEDRPRRGASRYDREAMRGRTLRIALLVFFVSTLAGVYFATQLNLAYPEYERRSWPRALTINLMHYWMWGALVSVVVLLGRRFRFENRGWATVPIHVIASVVLTIVQLLAVVVVLNLVLPPPAFTLGYARINFHSSLPTYWLILFVYWAADYSGRAARLKASLTEARLDALTTQLNPHFLFNTLNSISALMYTDTEAADRMMTRLSEFLRSTIQNNGAQEVTLGEELDFLNRYLEIEKIRFEERLRVAVRADAEALEGLVPAFSLQPIVENSLRHGIGPRESGGSISIEARRLDGRLVVQVADDGVGAPDQVREGIGLRNTRARLDAIYEGAARFEAGNAEEGGFLVRVDVPFRTPSGGLL